MNQRFCSDHKEVDSEDPVTHLKQRHKPGSFVVDRKRPKVYYVVLPNGKVKKTNYNGVSSVLQTMKKI